MDNITFIKRRLSNVIITEKNKITDKLKINDRKKTGLYDHDTRSLLLPNEWINPEKENILSFFDRTLDKVYLSKKKEDPAFTLEELPHVQFPVPPQLMPIYRFSRDNPSPLMEAIFIYEAFIGIFEYFLNDDFGSIDEYKKYSNETLGEMRDIADHLNKVAQDVGISKIFGGLAGAAGGILCIVGVGLSPVTFGTSLVVSAVGASIGVAGGVTSTGAAIAEEVFKKIDQNTFKEKFEKFKSGSEIMHAFSYEFVIKSSEAGLWNDNESEKAFQVLSAISKAFLNRDLTEVKVSSMNSETITKAGKLGMAVSSQIKNLVTSLRLITKAHKVTLGVRVTDEAFSIGNGLAKAGVTAAGLTDEAFVNLSAGIVKSAGVTSLAARSFTGALSALGVVFGVADIIAGALKIKNRSELAARLSSSLDVVEGGNDCAIAIYNDLIYGLNHGL